jgi:hypothetical protein
MKRHGIVRSPASRRFASSWRYFGSCCLLVSAALGIQTRKIHPDARVHRALAGMNAPAWRQREAALHQLIALGGSPADPPTALAHVIKQNPTECAAIHTTLISGLLRADALEAQYERDGKHFSTEEFGNYVATLIWAVGALHDPRAVPALLGQINSGNGATQALASLGMASFPAVLRLADSRGPTSSTAWLTRCSALATLAKMAESNNRARLNPRSVAVLESTLEEAARDPDYGARVEGIRGLGALGDPGQLPLLRSVGRKFANTRNEANRAIKRIRSAGRVGKRN